MLLPEEQRWVERDPAIPGLGFAMDAARFAAGLRASFPQLKVLGAQRRYLRYKPGENCLAAYTIDTGDEPLRCHVKVFRGDASEKLSKARERYAAGTAKSGWSSILDAECAEISVFPWDGRVPALARLADATQRRRLLGKAVKRTQPELVDAELRLLAYKPERRFVAALELGRQPRAVVKAYSESSFHASEHAIELQQHLVRFDSLRLARVLGSVPKRGVRVFEWLPGRLLTEAMVDGSWETSGCVAVGSVLSVFQQGCLETLKQGLRATPREFTLAQELAALESLMENLCFILPEVRHTALRIGETLRTRLPQHWNGGRVVHGDFYSKQVLLDEAGIGLIDLDEVGCGDARLDVGTFLAHLERERLCGRIESGRVDALEAAFVDGYLSRADCGRDPGIDVFTALKLVGRTQQFFRSCDPVWPKRIGDALERVCELLQLGKVAAVSTGAALEVPVTDSGLPGLVKAMDAEVMREVLPPALTLPGLRLSVVDPLAPRLLRVKPGRRALVEYTLETRDGERVGVLGKLRAKGLDRRVYAVMQRLVANGFDANSSDGVSVPTPVGAVESLGMWLQCQVEGTPALALLLSSRHAFAVRRLAESLCKLHGSGVDPGRSHGISDELQILERRYARLVSERPDLAARLRGLLACCHSVAEGLEDGVQATLHRDFYHDQVLFLGDRAFLLDLDLCALGAPALDVGNFVAHLVEHGIRHPETRERLQHCAAAFEAVYTTVNPSVEIESIRRWAFLALCRHVSISHELSERRPWCETLLSHCEAEAKWYQDAGTFCH